MSGVSADFTGRYHSSRRGRNHTRRRTAPLRERWSGLYILTTLAVSERGGRNASGVPHVELRRTQLQSHRRDLQTKRVGTGPSEARNGRYANFHRWPIIHHKPTENAPLNTYYIRHDTDHAEDTRT